MSDCFLVGVGVIVMRDGCVLLSQRKAGASDGVGFWAMPGGGLEATDDGVVAGAARELLEETGLKMIGGRVVPRVEEGRRPDGRPYATLFVRAFVDDFSTLSNPEPHKHEDWQWVPALELPEKTWSANIIVEQALDDMAAGVIAERFGSRDSGVRRG